MSAPSKVPRPLHTSRALSPKPAATSLDVPRSQLPYPYPVSVHGPLTATRGRTPAPPSLPVPKGYASSNMDASQTRKGPSPATLHSYSHSPAPRKATTALSSSGPPRAVSPAPGRTARTPVSSRQLKAPKALALPSPGRGLAVMTPRRATPVSSARSVSAPLEVRKPSPALSQRKPSPAPTPRNVRQMVSPRKPSPPLASRNSPKSSPNKRSKSPATASGGKPTPPRRKTSPPLETRKTSPRLTKAPATNRKGSPSISKSSPNRNPSPDPPPPYRYRNSPTNKSSSSPILTPPNKRQMSPQLSSSGDADMLVAWSAPSLTETHTSSMGILSSDCRVNSTPASTSGPTSQRSTAQIKAHGPSPSTTHIPQSPISRTMIQSPQPDRGLLSVSSDPTSPTSSPTGADLPIPMTPGRLSNPSPLHHLGESLPIQWTGASHQIDHVDFQNMSPRSPKLLSETPLSPSGDTGAPPMHTPVLYCSPKETNPSNNDVWHCAECHFSNEAHATQCQLCGIHRIKGRRPTARMWRCQCGLYNPDISRACKSCGAVKTSSQMQHPLVMASGGKYLSTPPSPVLEQGPEPTTPQPHTPMRHNSKELPVSKMMMMNGLTAPMPPSAEQPEVSTNGPAGVLPKALSFHDEPQASVASECTAMRQFVFPYPPAPGESFIMSHRSSMESAATDRSNTDITNWRSSGMSEATPHCGIRLSVTAPSPKHKMGGQEIPQDLQDAVLLTTPTKKRGSGGVQTGGAVTFAKQITFLAEFDHYEDHRLSEIFATFQCDTSKPQANGPWSCVTCFNENESSVITCQLCGSEKVDVQAPDSGIWSCPKCSLPNPDNCRKCRSCGKSRRPSSRKPSIDILNVEMATAVSEWYSDSEGEEDGSTLPHSVSASFAKGGGSPPSHLPPNAAPALPTPSSHGPSSATASHHDSNSVPSAPQPSTYSSTGTSACIETAKVDQVTLDGHARCADSSPVDPTCKTSKVIPDTPATWQCSSCRAFNPTATVTACPQCHLPPDFSHPLQLPAARRSESKGLALFAPDAQVSAKAPNHVHFMSSPADPSVTAVHIDPPHRTGTPTSPLSPTAEPWSCFVCFCDNFGSAKDCAFCGAERKTDEPYWNCMKCGLANERPAFNCRSCDTARPKLSTKRSGVRFTVQGSEQPIVPGL